VELLVMVAIDVTRRNPFPFSQSGVTKSRNRRCRRTGVGTTGEILFLSPWSGKSHAKSARSHRTPDTRSPFPCSSLANSR